MVAGGSTITQQLAKNLYLTPERSLTRKLQELTLAIWLETQLDKDQILTLYLNRVYLGAGAYGVEAASRRYFGKSAHDLDPARGRDARRACSRRPRPLAPSSDLDRARDRGRRGPGPHGGRGLHHRGRRPRRRGSSPPSSAPMPTRSAPTSSTGCWTG